MKKILTTIAILVAAGLMAGCVEDEMMMGYSGHGGYSTNHSNSGYQGHANNASGGYEGHSSQSQPQQRRWHSVARTNSPPVGYQGAFAHSASTSGSYTYSGDAPSGNGYSGR